MDWNMIFFCWDCWPTRISWRICWGVPGRCLCPRLSTIFTILAKPCAVWDKCFGPNFVISFMVLVNMEFSCFTSCFCWSFPSWFCCVSVLLWYLGAISRETPVQNEDKLPGFKSPILNAFLAAASTVWQCLISKNPFRSCFGLCLIEEVPKHRSAIANPDDCSRFDCGGGCWANNDITLSFPCWHSPTFIAPQLSEKTLLVQHDLVFLQDGSGDDWWKRRVRDETTERTAAAALTNLTGALPRWPACRDCK